MLEGSDVSGIQINFTNIIWSYLELMLEGSDVSGIRSNSTNTLPKGLNINEV